MKTLALSNPPMHGARALQTALAAAGLYPEKEIDDVYGPATARAVEKAKWNLGYPTTGIHRGHEIAGDQLMGYLAGKRELPSAYKLRRQQRLDTTTPEQKARAALVAHMAWAVANEPSIVYAQTRPMEALHHVRPARWTTDCSEFVTTLCCWAGVPDPNGLGYNGQGWTGTLLAHCHHLTQSELQVGDLVVFGAAPGHHVAMVYELGADPVLCSMGQTSDPRLISLSAERAGQARAGHGTTTFLAVL